jgi:site-specific recombinase XerC
MARGTAKISSDELGELSSENKKWFEVYENHAKAPKTKEYRDQVREFLEYKNHNRKSFQAFDQTDVSNFIEMLEHAGFQAGGINTYISAINACAKILHEEDSEAFTLSWLDGLRTKRKNKEESESPGEVLTVEQISLIKKYNREQGNEITRYIFDNLFRGGVQLEELQNIGKHDFREDIDFINESAKYFRKITSYLIKSKVYTETAIINSKHFKLSHQAYFYQCPFCKEVFENVNQNWILLRTKYDTEYRLVHAACKGRLK